MGRTGVQRWAWPSVAVVAAAMLGGCSATPEGAPIARAELPSFEHVAASQRRSDWCWAACAEMVLRYNGFRDVTQEELVGRFKAGGADQRANKYEIIRALAADPKAAARPTGELPSTFSLDLSKAAGAGYATLRTEVATDDAVEDLIRRQPVILGLRDYHGIPGHIAVVTGVDYRVRSVVGADLPVVGGVIDAAGTAVGGLTGSSKYDVLSVDIFDPDPDRGGAARLDAAMLKEHADFWLSRTRAEAIMKGVEDSLQAR